LQPEEFVFFLDENLCNCRPILETLGRLNIPFQRHLDRFPRGTLDEDWLPVVGRERLIVLTVDKDIRFNPLEIGAVVRHSVREFVYTSGNLSGAEMARILETAVPHMKKLCANHPSPFVASITKSGTVYLRYDRHGPLHRRRKKRVGAKH
jgi:hypothetical protein